MLPFPSGQRKYEKPLGCARGVGEGHWHRKNTEDEAPTFWCLGARYNYTPPPCKRE